MPCGSSDSSSFVDQLTYAVEYDPLYAAVLMAAHGKVIAGHAAPVLFATTNATCPVGQLAVVGLKVTDEYTVSSGSPDPVPAGPAGPLRLTPFAGHVPAAFGPKSTSSAVLR